MNDVLRAAIISAFQKLFPMLVVLNIVDLTDVATAIIMSFIADFITLIFLVVKTGQQPSGSTSQVALEVTTGPPDA